MLNNKLAVRQLFQDGGIKNGLYSIHILMLDGIDGGNTGVVVLHDGKMRGGVTFRQAGCADQHRRRFRI